MGTELEFEHSIQKKAQFNISDKGKGVRVADSPWKKATSNYLDLS